MATFLQMYNVKQKSLIVVVNSELLGSKLSGDKNLS